MLVFRSINQLKRQLGDTKHVQLCNICVENRKVTCLSRHCSASRSLLFMIGAG